MSKRVKVCIFLIVAMFVACITTPKASADTGPKPYISIDVALEGNYYITVLSKRETSGPYDTFTKENSYLKEHDFEEYSILCSLLDALPEEETYYLWDIYSKSRYEDGVYHYKFGYYPPNDFKLYVYNVDTKEIMISEAYQTYAFASEFEANLTDGTIVLKKSYDYGRQVLEFFVRLILTFVLELGIAFLFRFKLKSMVILGVTNLVTQIGLNVGINQYDYYHSKELFYGIPLLLLFELGILVVEAIIYLIFIKESKKKIVFYTILANLTSFVLGIILWACM